MRPRLRLQMPEDPIANGSIGEWNFEPFAGAGHRLNDIGTADDADELAVFYDRHPFDGVLL